MSPAFSSVIDDEALDRLTYRERYLNDGSPNRRTFDCSPSPGTSPLFAPKIVNLPVVTLQEPSVVHLGDRSLPPTLDIGVDHIVVHPDVGPFLNQAALNALRECHRFLQGEPTAAGRTLLVRGNGSSAFVKLSYPAKLGRYSASLDREKVVHSLTASAACSAVLDGTSGTETRFGFLLDTGAAMSSVMRNSQEHGELVCIYRPAVVVHNLGPRNIIDLFPAFSLISRFASGADASASLNEMWRLFGCPDATTFAWTNVIHPILESMMSLAIDWGLLPEPHAQNIVLAVVEHSDTAERDVLAVWRDGMSFCLDQTIADHRLPGFSDAFPPRRVVRSTEHAVRERSARLDHMAWEYLIAPLVDAGRTLGASDVRLLTQIRDFVRSALSRRPGYLPAEEWWARSLELPLPGDRINPVRIHGMSPMRSASGGDTHQTKESRS